jgi:hypothetical protein
MKLEVAHIAASDAASPTTPPIVVVGSGVSIPTVDIRFALFNHCKYFCDLCSLWVSAKPTPNSALTPNAVPVICCPVLSSCSAICLA